MKDEPRNRRRNLLWALSASLILHGFIIALLLYRLPEPPEQPQEDQAVNVTLVPQKPAPEPPRKQAKTEKPPDPQDRETPKPPPIAVLKPVFQFSDKDTGPRKSLDGSSQQDGSPANDNNPQPPVMPNDATNEPVAVAGNDRADSTKDTQTQAIAEKDADPTPMADTVSDGEIALPASSQVPQRRPQPSKGASSLPGVRRAYSQGATGDVLATTSMAGVSRNQRASRLCTSALQQKLLQSSYLPALVPLVPLKAGNVLDVPDTAFRTRTAWYNLGFRCEVDTNATTVLSFAFRVGTAIPPDQWAGLGLPMLGKNP